MALSEFLKFKHFDSVLNEKLEPFINKVLALIDLWKSVSQMSGRQHEIQYMVRLIDWIKFHTLNIVLNAEWRNFKGIFESQLLNIIENTRQVFFDNKHILRNSRILKDVIRNQWNDETLTEILKNPNISIGPREIDFFRSETAYVVLFRLHMLCKSDCEDLALNLATTFMKCHDLAVTKNLNLNITEDQRLFCFDIQVALLFRYKKMSEVEVLLKKLSLKEGIKFVERFSKKLVRKSKVWREYPYVTYLASFVFVREAVTVPFDESGLIVKDLLELWITLSIKNNLLQNFKASLRKIAQMAIDSRHIYVCCKVIQEKMDPSYKSFIIEMYVRAMTPDINHLQSQQDDNDQMSATKTSVRLASGFCNLADILKDNAQAARECILTAFSLDPTLDRLKKIENFAKASGFQVTDVGEMWKCKLHPPIKKTVKNDYVCSKCKLCGEWMSKPDINIPFLTNFALTEALDFRTLGITSELCDDLTAIVNGPRYHLLNWFIKWKDLHKLCVMYLNDIEHTKNHVKELKFVNLDFLLKNKREPDNEEEDIETPNDQKKEINLCNSLKNVSTNKTSFQLPHSVMHSSILPRVTQRNIRKTVNKVTPLKIKFEEHLTMSASSHSPQESSRKRFLTTNSNPIVSFKRIRCDDFL